MSAMPAPRRSVLSALVATTALATVGSATAEASGESDATLNVTASFYPLAFVAERVGGDLVEVSNLTPAGTEPHDMELTPQSMASLQESDLVVYLAGFAAAVDDGVAGLPAEQVLDVTSAAHLDLEGDEHDHEAGDEHADDDAVEDDEHDDDEGDEHHEGVDPHFWLDPTRLADVADETAARLSELAPESADEFAANAADLRADLEALDEEFETALASCETTELVTSHTAFGYLADRYGFTQVGITGITPHDEPSPADLAEIVHFVDDHGVTTIYTETLVDPAIAETVAAETGASTAVLDPLEGLSDDSAGADYLEVMRSNLEVLRDGQGCA